MFFVLLICCCFVVSGGGGGVFLAFCAMELTYCLFMFVFIGIYNSSFLGRYSAKLHVVILTYLTTVAATYHDIVYPYSAPHKHELHMSIIGKKIPVGIHFLRQLRATFNPAKRQYYNDVICNSVSVLLLNNYITLPTSCLVEPKCPHYPITSPPVTCLIHFVSFSTTKLNKLEMT